MFSHFVFRRLDKLQLKVDLMCPFPAPYLLSLESIRVPLHNSQFKINIIHLILGLGAAPQLLLQT